MDMDNVLPDIDAYDNEIWSPIKNYPEYMVSTRGRVWSNKKGKLLKTRPMDDWGHVGVDLCKNGKRAHKYMHRLMAEAFLPNPDNLPVVRHINDIPDDNIIDNLAWGTWGDNTQDAIKNGSFKYPTDEDREKGWKVCRVPIIAINLKSGERTRFDGVGIASRELGICRTGISKVLTGKRDQTMNYKFEYAEKGDWFNERDN